MLTFLSYSVGGGKLKYNNSGGVAIELTEEDRIRGKYNFLSFNPVDKDFLEKWKLFLMLENFGFQYEQFNVLIVGLDDGVEKI